MATAPGGEGARERRGLSGEERRVIFASSLGTVLEWYDFYLYAALAPFFATLFFPPGNETAALLTAFATYAAGFLFRPFGALVFGRIGDLLGRRHTFLITIAVMGLATFAMGLLPTFATIGWLAPILLVVLRLVQGLALGGEYGGRPPTSPNTPRSASGGSTRRGCRRRERSASSCRSSSSGSVASAEC